MDSVGNNFYYDLQKLQADRFKAAADPAKAQTEQLGQVAQQFEGLFTNMVFKQMRQATFGESLFTNQQTEMFQGMLDQQYSEQIGQSGNLGLAQTIVEQMQHYVDGKTQDVPANVKPLSREYNFMSLAKYRDDASSSGLALNDAPEVTPLKFDVNELRVERARAEAFTGFNDRADFVNKLLPHARRAARELGTDPKILIAQAALETGWGKSLPTENGQVSFNLFGIKSGSQWDGQSVAAGTHEYYDGSKTSIVDQFRAYEGIGQSFDDYVSLIKRLPRYENALQVASDPEAYVRALQSGGYATDPNYANKILQFYRSEEIGGDVEYFKKYG